MRKLEVARLASKFERISAELHRDVGRLRSAGYGDGAKALAICSRHLEELSRALKPLPQPTRRGLRAAELDITKVVRLLGKGIGGD